MLSGVGRAVVSSSGDGCSDDSSDSSGGAEGRQSRSTAGGADGFRSTLPSFSSVNTTLDELTFGLGWSPNSSSLSFQSSNPSASSSLAFLKIVVPPRDLELWRLS